MDKNEINKIDELINIENLSILKFFKLLLHSFYNESNRFIKYQIVTKLLLSIIIFPFFWSITNFLLVSNNINAINHSVLIGLIKSPAGIVFFILAIILILIGIILEVFGFITISAQILHKQHEGSYKNLLKENIRKIPIMFELRSLILIFYLSFLIPLTNIGFSLSFLKDIKIPNFVITEIVNDSTLLIFYVLVLIIMIIISIRWIFTFHFIVIGNLQPSKAMKASSLLIKNNFKLFIKSFAGIAVISTLITSTIVFVWISFIVALSIHLNLQNINERIIMVFLLILQQIALSLGLMLLVPFEVYHFTVLFYRFIKHDPVNNNLKNKYPVIIPRQKKSIIDLIINKKKILVALTLIVLLLVSIPMGIFFKEIFHNDNKIQIMAHRGGSADGPENTIYVITKAIENGAHWVEIDVQRTKDGIYVLNHDDTFKRVAGENKKVSEMNYVQIKQLDVGIYINESFRGTKVPTLEEVLDLCKNKIGVNIELKGSNVDEKMIDDVVDMINKREMKSQVILTSFDYNLVEKIENKYPDFNSGFIDFIAFGNVANLKADYIILEETVAKQATINKIHEANKKAIVWTVNNPESMDKFVQSNVDVIITDDVRQLKTVFQTRSNITDNDLLLQQFISSF